MWRELTALSLGRLRLGEKTGEVIPSATLQETGTRLRALTLQIEWSGPDRGIQIKYIPSCC